MHHLNLCFSSIEEEQWKDVICKCYWPLLQLAESLNVPVGIEATGYTLEKINEIDPNWINKLIELRNKGTVEVIGSGYSQLIGPLVPAEVNRANLHIGNLVYRGLLGFRPDIALINEQAYSPGLIEHYIDSGYKAIIMEWNNPASLHNEWEADMMYYPQYACGNNGEKIPVIWNNSIGFQKFQRFAHSDMELEEYLQYLEGHIKTTTNVYTFPLYGNDIEIFDFRPGRYHTEAFLSTESEWVRISKLYERLLADKRFKFVLPTSVLGLLKEPKAGKSIHLESPSQPIVVKKQNKYNILRWAITGRDDMGINTQCYEIYEALKLKGHFESFLDAKPTEQSSDSVNLLSELCYLWSSDFRTHITNKRWARYKERLSQFRNSLQIGLRHSIATIESEKQCSGQPPEVNREGRFLAINTSTVKIRLNCKKGLAIDSLWFDSFDGDPLCGTLEHGYYDDISLGSDWYSGHSVLELFGQPKVTDLNETDPKIIIAGGVVTVEGQIATSLGPVIKKYEISCSEASIKLFFKFNWEKTPIGSFRLGAVTLNPSMFDKKSLFYRTCNGGSPETYYLDGSYVDHGDAVSYLVSARSGLGVTEGWIELGDKKHRLLIEIDKSSAALIGLINYREVKDTYFCRLAFSAGEVDETRRYYEGENKDLECCFCIRKI